MNKKNGLPTLPDKSIDLGVTDPQWGSDMKENIRSYIEGRILDNAHKVHFNDNITPEFTKAWFNELNRVCKRIVLVISDELVLWFIRNFPNIDPTIIPVLWKNGFSKSKVAKGKRRSLYLYYGKFEEDKKQLYDYLAKEYYTSTTNLIPFTLYWGFTSKEKHFNHPSPKGLEIPLHLFKQLKPDSIIDPFSGSGTYCHVAKILNIPYIGYEINDKEYKEDTEWRFAQKTIERFL
ncbi:MAG: DNA methyltransferase [Candidatus Hodarchaeota archaeon]